MTDQKTMIDLRGVTKRFGALDVVHGIDLTINEGEFVVFVGPSGCGKSTLLRMIAGLEDVTDGEIWIDGRDVTDDDPSKRGIAMVFQSYALYPHMSVKDNLGFGLKLAGTPAAERETRIMRAAKMLQIDISKSSMTRDAIIEPQSQKPGANKNPDEIDPEDDTRDPEDIPESDE